jgi:hypothetical protein
MLTFALSLFTQTTVSPSNARPSQVQPFYSHMDCIPDQDSPFRTKLSRPPRACPSVLSRTRPWSDGKLSIVSQASQSQADIPFTFGQAASLPDQHRSVLLPAARTPSLLASLICFLLLLSLSTSLLLLHLFRSPPLAHKGQDPRKLPRGRLHHQHLLHLWYHQDLSAWAVQLQRTSRLICCRFVLDSS